MHDHPHGERDELGNEWTAPSIMMGPVKLICFYDDHHHGPTCLLARAAAWFMQNPDWQIVDLMYNASARIVSGDIQSAIVVYAQDSANPIQPLQVLDEPFHEKHLTDLEKHMPNLDDLIPDGMVGLVIDPRTLTGTRDEVVQKLRDQGVPDYVIEMMLPEDGENK